MENCKECLEYLLKCLEQKYRSKLLALIGVYETPEYYPPACTGHPLLRHSSRTPETISQLLVQVQSNLSYHFWKLLLCQYFILVHIYRLKRSL